VFLKPNAVMLYPSGCLNPNTFALRLVMFTGRPNAWRYCFRLSVLTRVGLTTFPWINPAPCERRTVLCLASCSVCYLSVRDNSTAHNIINAIANQAVRVMAWPFVMLQALNKVRLVIAAGF
jgi:hypothetical protein